jgi:hypothetical protein
MAKRTATKKRASRARSTALVKPMAAVPAAFAAEGGGPLLTEGFITITIGKETFELHGTVGDYLKVEFHKPFDKAPDLGTIPEMVAAVASGLGVADGPTFEANLKEKITKLGKVPGLEKVAKALNESTVKVTDLGIDTQADRYQFGFGVDLTGAQIAYAGISLDAFGLLFTYTKQQTA